MIAVIAFYGVSGYIAMQIMLASSYYLKWIEIKELCTIESLNSHGKAIVRIALDTITIWAHNFINLRWIESA